MEQLQLFPASIIDEITLFEYLEPYLLETMANNGVPPEYLIGRKNKTYFSVLYRDTVVFSFYFGKTVNYIYFPVYALAALPKDFGSDRRVKDGKIRVRIPDANYASAFVTVFLNALDAAIDRSQREYSCCSRYMECSKIGKCVNPHPEISMDCRYKVHLKHGENFFMRK